LAQPLTGANNNSINSINNDFVILSPFPDGIDMYFAESMPSDGLGKNAGDNHFSYRLVSAGLLDGTYGNSIIKNITYLTLPLPLSPDAITAILRTGI
jgi:hypothetical protein